MIDGIITGLAGVGLLTVVWGLALGAMTLIETLHRVWRERERRAYELHCALTRLRIPLYPLPHERRLVRRREW